ncbi:MAG: hypothetical protein GEV11_07205 [Streptosporangiales bacterium]|nr:hypothetical protein [Streptosporangiales bacterium]
MDSDMYGGSSGSLPPETYWRRRVIALTGIIGIIALLAWACSGASSDERGNAAPAVATGSATPAKPKAAPPKPLPTVTVTVTATPKTPPSAPKRPGDICDKRDLVATFMVNQDSYSSGDKPRFQLTVVNTGRRLCTWDVGRKAMEIKVTSGGDRIWSSADCTAGEDSEVRKLVRGRPYSTVITWDRTRSFTDCRDTRAEARPGTYVATLDSGGVRGAQEQVFRLR